jgi:hypothetical protein
MDSKAKTFLVNLKKLILFQPKPKTQKIISSYNMPSYNTAYLWDNEYQTRTISGWDQILMDWDESLCQNAFVATVLENLKATSNWDSGKDYPLSHFLRFIDYEPNAMNWFLYEVVSLRWSWGESRIDYVKDLVRMVDLDSTFPVFPSSPCNTLTVREFLTNHLNEDELEYVDMPAKQTVTTHIGNMTIQIAPDGRRIINTNSNPTSIQTSRVTTPLRQEEEPVEIKREKVKKVKKVKPALMQIRFNRKSHDDDTINISPEVDNTYSIVFRDTSAGITHSFFDMDEMDVQLYLSQVLRMSCMDQDPYDCIQLNFPGRPQVILPFNPDSYTREIIYDSVETIMENWPVTI